MIYRCALLSLFVSAEAFSIGGALSTSPTVRRAAVCALEPLPPAGFVWADDEAPSVATSTATSSTAVAEPEPAPKAAPAKAAKAAPAKPAKKPKKVVSNQGIFAPLVLGAKRVMGEQELKELRASIITKHSKVIANFVDTSDSPFGQLVLKQMFAYADKDGNGTLDKEEVSAALKDLGFGFYNEKQIEQIVNRADTDDNEVIDFEEFVKETPKTLRTGLIKLAKQNGHDLGFLA